MRAYAVTIQRWDGDDTWLADLGSLNWQFLHVGRDTLEAAIRSTIEQLTGDKGFGVAMSFV